MTQLLKPIDQYSDLENTAYHEAAHAMVHHVLGMRFKEVSIIPDEDTLGRIVGSDMPSWVVEALEWGPTTTELRS